MNDASRLTDEQQAVVEAFMTSRRMVVNALAGTGKTFTAIECLKRLCGKKGIYLCFNKAIAKEMNEKMRRAGIKNASAHTIHSFALNFMSEYMDGREISNNAASSFIEKSGVFRKTNGSHFTDKWDINRLKTLSMEFLSAWCHSDQNCPETFFKCYVNRGMEAQLANLRVDPEHFRDIMMDLWQRMVNDRSLPLTHDIYLKLFHLGLREAIDELGGFKYDFLIVDEAQDLFPVAEAIASILEENGARLLCFGDRYQQIYAWNKSINTMERMEKDADIFSLTKSFRCNGDVVEKALPWLRFLGYKGKFSGREKKTGKGKNFAVLSRTVAGVFDALCQCADAGLDPADICVVGGVSNCDFSGIEDRINFVSGRRDRIKCRRMRECGSEKAYDQLANSMMDMEMIKAKAICDRIGYAKTAKMLEKIRANGFAGTMDGAKAVISTGHKAKGLEFGHVITESFSNFMHDGGLVPDSRIPLKARLLSRIPRPQEISEYEKKDFILKLSQGKENGIPVLVDAEELRLNYVAITRAIDSVNPCGLDMDEKSFLKAMSMIKTGNIVLTDRDMSGNICFYDKNRPEKMICEK